MAVEPEAPEKPQPTAERVVRSLVSPITERPRGVALIAVAAGAGSLAPFPWGIVVAVTCVIAASDLARKR